MKKLSLLALVVALLTATSLSAAQYCDATITSTNGAHTAQITCTSLGNNQYYFEFVSADAFTRYNTGSNFFMNVNGEGGFQVSKNLTQDGNTLYVIVESNVAPNIYVGDFFVYYEDGEAWFKLPTDADFSQVCEGVDTPDTALEQQPSIQPNANKILENGQLFVISNGVRYNVLGMHMK